MLVFATLLATLSSTVRSRFWSPGRVLKRKQNLTSQQNIRLRELLRYNLQTVRAYLLKEDFQQFWEYNSPTWAGNFLDFWCYQTMRSRIEPTGDFLHLRREHAH